MAELFIVLSLASVAFFSLRAVLGPALKVAGVILRVVAGTAAVGVIAGVWLANRLSPFPSNAVADPPAARAQGTACDAVKELAAGYLAGAGDDELSALARSVSQLAAEQRQWRLEGNATSFADQINRRAAVAAHNVDRGELLGNMAKQCWEHPEPGSALAPDQE